MHDRFSIQDIPDVSGSRAFNQMKNDAFNNAYDWWTEFINRDLHGNGPNG